MRDLLARHDPDALLACAQTRFAFPLLRDARLAAWRRPRADPALRFGAHPQQQPGRWHIGAQPPLGRIDAATLRALATLVRDAGNGSLHLTPWQSVLLPEVPTHAVQYALDRLAALGFACDRREPLARLIACAGSVGCAKGLADTKADALRLAGALPADVEVHLSGCSRSCAAAHPVPFTLLAVAPNRYDLYQRVDASRAEGGFGTCVARDLTIEQAAERLARPPRSPFDA